MSSLSPEERHFHSFWVVHLCLQPLWLVSSQQILLLPLCGEGLGKCSVMEALEVFLVLHGQSRDVFRHARPQPLRGKFTQRSVVTSQVNWFMFLSEPLYGLLSSIMYDLPGKHSPLPPSRLCSTFNHYGDLDCVNVCFRCVWTRTRMLKSSPIWGILSGYCCKLRGKRYTHSGHTTGPVYI